MLRIVLVLMMALAACAADADQFLKALASPERPARLQAIADIAASRDSRAVAFLDDYRQGSIFALADGRIVIVLEIVDGHGQPLDPLKRTPVGERIPESALTALDVSGPERKAAVAAITQLHFSSPEVDVRLGAVTKAGDAGGAANRSALGALMLEEKDPRVLRSLQEGVALIDLADGDEPTQRAALATLSDFASLRARDRLRVLATGTGPLADAAKPALARIESRQSTVRSIQTVFAGVSAGSILVLMALGLSITFGLMGVINMAHGEMLMIGAYATLLTQWAFGYLPAGMQSWYLVVGIGTGFLAAAATGWLLELLVIRHLYGRPLETLLATWGISYLLIQTIRTIFGDNQAVTAPPWLVGGWEPMPELVLPWNRIFIIGVTVVAVSGVVVLFRWTRLGLLLRATVQSRVTASSLGVDTRRIDGLTFAIGSGLAGAAGCVFTLIGGLKPDMGQEFIIDSFLVVATGGVGNLAGVCASGFGLGLLNKFLEPVTQAVFAKVFVLVAVIIFLQFKPAGLFPPKGRLADV